MVVSRNASAVVIVADVQALDPADQVLLNAELEAFPCGDSVRVRVIDGAPVELAGA